MNAPGEIPKIHTGLAQYISSAPFRYLALSLLSIALLAGCSTVATYNPHTAAGPAKPVGYPILVYTEDMAVPRPCEVIGTISIHATSLTMFGGSVESEMLKVLRTAREKGADVVQTKSIEKPDFSHANYRLTADLLRYADTWETLPIREEGFAAYLGKNQRNLDPIEGVWNGYGQIPHQIGIMRDTSKPGRDFIGFILNTENPTWLKGYKKIDIQRGAQPGTYTFDYYLDNFSKRETTVIWGGTATFTLAIPTSEEDTDIITYSKSR
ncbi:MAG: hypothetical protein ABSA45_08930 [Verrucomicrobiota bacterium]|jgi:hypothetical protein